MQVSFILPVINEVKLIKCTINSILNQVYIDQVDYEILISDGGSTDGTLEIISNIILNNPNVHLIKNSQKIVSSGFNLALNKVNGEIIIRVDGHCKIEQNYIEKCYNLLMETDADIVGGVIETISSGLIGNAISIAQSYRFGVGGVKFRNKDSKEAGYVDTLAFGAHRREIFADIGGYDEEMVCNQDDEFNHRVLQAGKKIWMDPTIKIKYYSRSSFSNLFKQYFNYGCFKVRGIQKRRQIISIRHLIPATFVVGLMGTLIPGFILQQPWFFSSVLTIYMIINILFSIIVAPSISLIPLLFLSYWTLHLGYGLGFIWGFIRFLGKWSDTSLKDNHFNKEKFILNSRA